MNDARFAAIEERLHQLEVRAATAPAASIAGEVASDYEMSGQYGDPAVRFPLKEKYFPNDDNVGKKFSECTPEYLDATAKYYDAYAYALRHPKDGKAADEKKAGYKELDAKRARGHAKRIREGGGTTERLSAMPAAEDEMPDWMRDA